MGPQSYTTLSRLNATKARRQIKHIKLEGRGDGGKSGGWGRIVGDKWRMNFIQT